MLGERHGDHGETTRFQSLVGDIRVFGCQSIPGFQHSNTVYRNRLVKWKFLKKQPKLSDMNTIFRKSIERSTVCKRPIFTFANGENPLRLSQGSFGPMASENRGCLVSRPVRRFKRLPNSACVNSGTRYI